MGDVVHIDEQECTACGACVNVCPKHILRIDYDKMKCVCTDESKCDKLRGCERACGQDAIHIH